MGHIPDQIPDTGDLSIETRSHSLVIYAPHEQVSAHDDGETVRIEVLWEDLPAISACLHHGEWVRRGSEGEPFHGVPFAYEVHTDAGPIARLPSAEAAERLAGIARGHGIGPVRVRELSAFVSPELAEMAQSVRAEDLKELAAERERTWALVASALASGAPITFAVVADGRVTAIHTGERIGAADAERRALRLAGASEWIRADSVRHARPGDDLSLAAAAAAVPEIGRLSAAALAERLAQG